MIKFKFDTQLEVVTDFDEKTDNITGVETETFKAGERVDAEIISDREEKGDVFVDLQFGEGSVAFGVQRDSFEVIA